MFTCKQCGSWDVFRSRRRGVFDHLMACLNLWPYWCHCCGSRFYDRRRENHDRVYLKMQGENLTRPDKPAR
jgi:hypothetical protein